MWRPRGGHGGTWFLTCVGTAVTARTVKRETAFLLIHLRWASGQAARPAQGLNSEKFIVKQIKCTLKSAD